jgi:hypothetical protein
MAFGRDGKSEIAERLRETAEDLMELVSAQVKLIRLELLHDARTLGARLVRFAVFLPLAVLGYGLLAGAGAYALGTQIGLGWALLAVGGVHLAVGAWGLVRAARTLRELRVLDRSGEELERSLKTVSPAPALPPAPADRH